jgi:argininosuccinate synthase
VAINGETLDLVGIFKKANQLAGYHGIGIGSHVVENRFVGVKSRGIYEAPGVELLGSTYEFLLQFILDRRARDLHDTLSKIISLQIYQGYWMDLSTTAALTAIKTINRLVTGTIAVRLYKGTVNFETGEDTIEGMPNSLYTEDSSMEDIGTYDHVDAEGLLKILTVSARNVGNKQFPEFNR